MHIFEYDPTTYVLVIYKVTGFERENYSKNGLCSKSRLQIQAVLISGPHNTGHMNKGSICGRQRCSLSLWQIQ